MQKPLADSRNLALGLLRLTRYQDYVAFVTVTTLIGFLISGLHLSWQLLPRLFLVLMANLLAVGFSFMINDVEDAPDDALSAVKSKRNPVTAGLISRPTAYTASLLVAFLAGLIFFWLGPVPFWLGITSLILGALYSWRLIRLKSIPVFDLLSHCLMLAGLQLATAYFALVPYSGFSSVWVAPFLLVSSVSLYGQLFNEVRDFECDIKAGITHTTALVGIKTANILMHSLLAIAGIMFVYCLFTGIIPLWFFSVLVVLGIVFLSVPLVQARKSRGIDKTRVFQKPVLTLGIISLSLWFISRFF